MSYSQSRKIPPLKVFNFLVAGALKFSGVRLSRFSRSRCNGHGGGSFRIQMNLFDRFARVIKVMRDILIFILGTVACISDWYSA